MGRQRQAAGFSLVELVVVIAVMGVLFMLGFKSFAVWLQSLRVRAAAESIQNGLQVAKAEALKRNGNVTFALVDGLTAACAPVATGTAVGTWAWLVIAGGVPGNCDPADAGNADTYVQGRPGAEGSSSSAMQVNTNLTSVTFTGLARLSPVPAADMAIDVSSDAGACGSGAESIRCLRVVVSTMGQIRMCDPKVEDAGDPRKC
ncbi:MAG: GspH/FimT family pseudopilin [Azonexus sp.]